MRLQQSRSLSIFNKSTLLPPNRILAKLYFDKILLTNPKHTKKLVAIFSAQLSDEQLKQAIESGFNSDQLVRVGRILAKQVGGKSSAFKMYKIASLMGDLDGELMYAELLAEGSSI